jgi:hypothetical protein
MVAGLIMEIYAISCRIMLRRNAVCENRSQGVSDFPTHLLAYDI